jgi:hypothetical protein
MGSLTFHMQWTEASTVGISSADDLVVFASVNDGLVRDVQWFAHESARAFRSCPYWEIWRKNVTLFKEGFNFNRALYDMARNAKWIAHDPVEVAFDVEDPPRLVPVSKAETEACVSRLDPYVLASFTDAPRFNRLTTIPGSKPFLERDPSSSGAMLRYYWESLRTVDGRKTLTGPLDRPDTIFALARALVVERLHIDEDDARGAEHDRWVAAGCPGNWNWTEQK